MFKRWRVLNSKKELIICDWKRQSGKTYTEARLIKEKSNKDFTTKFLVLAFNIRYADIFEESLKKVFGNFYKIERVHNIIRIMETIGSVKFIVAEIVVVTNLENPKGMKFDYCIIDEKLLNDRDLSLIRNMLVKQIYLFGTFDIDYIK